MLSLSLSLPPVTLRFGKGIWGYHLISPYALCVYLFGNPYPFLLCLGKLALTCLGFACSFLHTLT
ncbi:hypothetical protein QBC40DRAFT_285227 [Triangularia verruculosa]|uniref:Uncharacterized protein n=1 Tax=Triangularia verruculosa TaxID=2587418 RepID=A0AAN7ASC8_9PEZI|nr:hypothetical protein QBC40DRAFT_285227 [Triangularia verruculosa]